jgi:hypothetical protein
VDTQGDLKLGPMGVPNPGTGSEYNIDVPITSVSWCLVSVDLSCRLRLTS